MSNEEVRNVVLDQQNNLFNYIGRWFSSLGRMSNKSADMDYGMLNPKRDFTLHDQEGKVFHFKDHRGQIVLLFFGYTSCPDVCPTTLSKVSRVYRLLGSAMRQKVLTLFVTVDPKRDTPAKLKEYMQYFNINAMGWPLYPHL